jgi:branched-chain amino acid transport system permease protein
LFAGLLFQGPPIVARLVEKLVTVRSSPNTFVDAIAPLASLDVTPLLAYSLSNTAYLRFVLVGVVLIYFIQNRPRGLLGHRKQFAASIDLTGRQPGADRDDRDGSGPADE